MSLLLALLWTGCAVDSTPAGPSPLPDEAVPPTQTRWELLVPPGYFGSGVVTLDDGTLLTGPNGLVGHDGSLVIEVVAGPNDEVVLQSWGTGYQAVNSAYVASGDADADGDLDVLTFDMSRATVEYRAFDAVTRSLVASFSAPNTVSATSAPRAYQADADPGLEVELIGYDLAAMLDDDGTALGTHATPPGPRIGDRNGDSVEDFLTRDGEVLDGVTNAVITALSITVYASAIIDADSDGGRDLMVYHPGGWTLFNDGDLSFRWLDAYNNARSPVMLDTDLDGRRELVMADWDRGIFVLDPATGVHLSEIDVPDREIHAQSLRIWDHDGDGSPSLLVTTEAAMVRYDFATGWGPLPALWLCDPHVNTGDTNGDGLLDVLVSRCGDGTNRTWTMLHGDDGRPLFSFRYAPFAFYGGPSDPYSAFGDVNADGEDEWLVPDDRHTTVLGVPGGARRLPLSGDPGVGRFEPGGNTIVVHARNDTLAFRNGQRRWRRTSAGLDMEIADINSDGWDEVLIAGYAGLEVVDGTTGLTTATLPGMYTDVEVTQTPAGTRVALLADTDQGEVHHYLATPLGIQPLGVDYYGTTYKMLGHEGRLVLNQPEGARIVDLVAGTSETLPLSASEFKVFPLTGGFAIYSYDRGIVAYNW